MRNCNFNCDLNIGQLVISKMGRDRGKIFVILKVVGCTAYIADGDLRKVEKPKKKNIKHIIPIGKSIEIKDKLINGTIKNEDLKFIISKYKRADH